jgi:hypothetical protein
MVLKRCFHLRSKKSLNSAFVAPEADVEAVAEAETVGAAEFGNVRRGGVEFGCVAAFGHEQDA